MAKAKSPKQILDGLVKECRNSYARWDRLYYMGGSDPFGTDGENLELVRNHIIYYKREIAELCEQNGFDIPDLPETPPEVDRNYMARADKIRENAKKALAIYKQDPNYQRLCKESETLTEKQKKESSITAVIRYAKGLENAIENDDLVTMRRHERPVHYQERFKDCIKRVAEIKAEEPKENEQISWF